MDIDLHIHTNASDGSFSPHEILALACDCGLCAVAITDHDTIDGVRAVSGPNATFTVRFLPGVEITAEPPPNFELSDSLHILGYGISIDSSELNALLSKLQKARDDRTPLIIQRLQDLGMDLTYAQLADSFSGPQLGRPHIAQLMVRNGYVASVDEAFDRYLGRGNPAYVDKFRVPCKRAIKAIRHAGGVAVLAHPGLYRLPEVRLETLLRILKESGLQGLEVYYPEHSAAQTACYETLMKKYGLLATGGTDFHGGATPGIQIGSGRGDFHVPYILYEKILKALESDDHARSKSVST